MSPDSVDVSVVLLAHREGILIHRTLRSVLRAVDFARDRGFSCEVIVVLDQADSTTAQYFARQDGLNFKFVAVGFGDPGCARNVAVNVSQGKYVAFVDGDDLVSRNWFAAALAFSHRYRERGRRLVMHPEVNVMFGADTAILMHIDQERPDWHTAGLFAGNFWTALILAHRDDLLAVPYRTTAAESGFGYEDWDWNCLAVDAGMVHKVVPGTSHYVRIKEVGSRNQLAQKSKLLVRPSPIFDRLATQMMEPLANESRIDGDQTNVIAGTKDLENILSNTYLLREWRDISEIEPDLFPSLERIRRCKFIEPPSERLGFIFGQILKNWGNPSHLIIVDELIADDRGMTAINYALALHDLGAEVVLVSGRTEKFQSPLAESYRLRFIEIGHVCTELQPHLLIQLLARTVLQRPPKTVQIVESSLGYEMVAAYGAAISQVSKVYASLLSLSLTNDGERAGLPVTYMPRVLQYLTGILTETNSISDWICETYGYTPNKCWVVPAAIHAFEGNRSLRRRRASSQRLRAVWVCDEHSKGCALLAARVMSLMPDWQFTAFIGFLSGDHAIRELSVPFQALPNVAVNDDGLGFEEAMNGAVAALYTGFGFGLPRALLRVALMGTPLVVTGVPGVVDFFGEENSYLVWEPHRPEAYVERLREIVADPLPATRRYRRARNMARNQFSWAALVESLRRIEGYI